MTPSISIREALADPKLLGGVLAGDSWRTWRTLMIAAMGEALTDDERRTFTKLTGREREPLQRIEEAHWVFRADVILEPFREEQGLGAIQTGAMFHACQTYVLARCSKPCRTFHTVSHCSERGGAFLVLRFDRWLFHIYSARR